MLVIKLFYSSSSASTTSGSTAILLPSIDPSTNTDSLDNLRANKLQTLHYQQILDSSVPIDNYRASVNYEFQVPSIVFDHSSLIYIINETNQTIVFGFGNANAFAETLGWPQTGIAMIFKGECVSTDANDILLLNGFIYDANRLTVAANITPSQISNISNNMNLTFGRNNTNTNYTSGIGNPQRYSPGVRYVDPSFFNIATGKLNSAYYANLNGSVDSRLDNQSGCYFNSLSQALIYDIVDPTNYDDRDAYNSLVDSVTPKNQSKSARNADASRAQRTRTARQMNSDNPAAFGARKGSSSRHTLRHTRTLFSHENSDLDFSNRNPRYRSVLRSTDGHKSAIKRRDFWGDIGDFFTGVGEAIVDTVVDVVETVVEIAAPIVDAVVDAFNTIVHVVETVVNTVIEIGKLVVTAIFGGTYDKTGHFDFEIGFDEPTQIYYSADIDAYCEACKVEAGVDLHGRFSFGKNGIETILNEGYVEAIGTIHVKAVARVSGDINIDKGITLAEIVLTNINIPGVFKLGPQVVLEVGVHIGLGQEIEGTFGAYIDWDRIYTKIDFKNPGSSQSNGWEPNNFQPVLTIDGDATLELGVYVQPKLELVLDVLNGIIRVAAGLALQCTAGLSASLNSDSPDCQGGVEIGPYIKLELSVYAEASLADNDVASTDYTIYEIKIPIGSQLCIGGNHGTGITSATTTGVTNPLIQCDMCCYSSYNTQPCGSPDCTCNGPGYREAEGGIVGYFSCVTRNPFKITQYSSNLCSSYGHTYHCS